MTRTAFNLQGDPRTPFAVEDIPNDASGKKALGIVLYDKSGNPFFDPGSIAPRHRVDGFLTTGQGVIAIPAGTAAVKVYCSVLARVGVGSAASPAAAVAQIQTITKGDATGGTALYTFQGQPTAATAWNAAAATFQTNFRALTSMDASIACGGGALNTAPVTVTFNTTTLAGDQPLITVDGSSLTGGVNLASMTPTVAISTAAVTSSGYVEAGTEMVFALAAADTNLYLASDSGTGVFRVSFFS